MQFSGSAFIPPTLLGRQKGERETSDVSCSQLHLKIQIDDPASDMPVEEIFWSFRSEIKGVRRMSQSRNSVLDYDEEESNDEEYNSKYDSSTEIDPDLKEGDTVRNTFYMYRHINYWEERDFKGNNWYTSTFR
ncbi:UNVERIFIED_CONTAM: hypothetical protein NCL1_38950 [Trichonephila clavipes]